MYVDLFDPNIDWSAFAVEGADTSQLRDVFSIMTAAGRRGIQSNFGILNRPPDVMQAQLAHEAAMAAAAPRMAALATEAGGFLTPDMYADFFETPTRLLGTNEYEPDTSYLDWMVQRRMTQEVEDRKEWDADITFKKMKEVGTVPYGDLEAAEHTMRNYEWGAGMKVWRTWFETNVFGIKMSTLAPKFRYEYFDNIAVNVYADLVSNLVATITSATNYLINDLNICAYEIMRLEDTFEKPRYQNAPLRLIMAPEWEKYMNAALAYNYSHTSEVLAKRFKITYTPKLTFTAASAKIYVVPDKHEKNELGTRVPYSVFGQTTDIDTFSDKISYRGAWGDNVDTVGRVLTFDTTSEFEIGTPQAVRVVGTVATDEVS